MIDHLTCDLDNAASDVQQFASNAVHAARAGRFGEAVASARRAAEYADRAARAARELVAHCEAMPPHKCELCGESVHEVDEHSVCLACARLDADGRHAVLVARVERDRKR